MTLTATKFTPEVMLSAPRRSPGVPNPSGTLALYTVSTYSFHDHEKTTNIRVLDIKSGDSYTPVDEAGASNAVWLNDDEILYLRSGDKGSTTLVVLNVKSSDASSSYEAGTIQGPIGDLKVKKLADGSVALACSAATTPGGALYNPETEPKPRSSAKVYTSLFVRHWDAWNSDKSNSIFYGVLEKKDGDKYALRDDRLTNALAGTGLSSPVPPFGGTGDFDIGPEGLVFVAKDPNLDAAMYTKTDLYFIPLKTFAEPKPPAPRIVKTPGLEGYSNSPVFSHCGRKVAFTRMRSNQYESDKPRLLLVPDISNPDKTEEFFATTDGIGGWDSRPESIAWSHDDAQLYVTAEHRARTILFALPSTPSQATSLPTPVPTPDGSVSDFRVFASSSSSSSDPSSKSDYLFITTTSLIDNSCYSLTHPATANSTILSSASKQGRSFGLSRDQVDSITVPGPAYDVHALVVRPSTYQQSSSEKKKYPLCMLIHGGPQGAWQDSWSTRWNPAVFAEQGYVVVCPNPTGSTSYGMALEDGIRGNWGGRPYDDLERCLDWVVDHMPEVDADRAVALGASYGGYMINWIQGHPLGRRFKALVCHDGVFSTLNQWATEELFFPIHDFEGTLYDNREGYEKWDPARFTHEWATPQLIIHSELDYRLPVTEGLSAFNVLQARKVPSKLLVFPDENHWVLKHENSLVWHREVLAWINKYSGIEDEHELVDEIEALKA
ncbi:Alpha/Beta hydrolase protein [Corynascus novoguineensis]|uniref:Dipeptidyl-peptidase V n=1 Tax=Corynascus novoguineensis TaxID=1126955 RepID=A0AAN7HUB7_9PEZI|nr:Alpha/Beta hydrolase protein [Corynascus novoguineensis]